MKKGSKGLKQWTLWAFNATTSTTSAIQIESDKSDENPPIKRGHPTESPIDLTNNSDQELTLILTAPEQPTPPASPVNPPNPSDIPLPPPPLESDNDNEHIIKPLDLVTLKKLATAGLKKARLKAVTREINLYAGW
jgi:hypothetical protein